MTTHARSRDWKLTTGYVVLLKIGWGVMALAVYLAAAAAIFDSAWAWWVVAALAIVGIATAAILPAPVPDEMIIGNRNRIGRR